MILCPFCHAPTAGQPCGNCGTTWGEFGLDAAFSQRKAN